MLMTAAHAHDEDGIPTAVQRAAKAVAPRRRGPSPVPVPGTFEVLGRWAEDLGIKWFDVMKVLKISRADAWRIMKGTAGSELARAIEELLVSCARHRGDARNPMEQFRQWQQLGIDLAKDRPEHFERVIKAVRDVIELLPPAKERPPVFVIGEPRGRQGGRKSKP